MNVSPDFLQKTASFIQKAAPVLEKSAADQHLLETIAPQLVDELVAAGVTPAEKRAEAIKQLTDGGVAKIASVAIRLAQLVQPEPMGSVDSGTTTSKQASAASSGGGRRNGVQAVHDSFESAIMQ